MCIPFAPEPAPTANGVELNEQQATGPRPLGFDFEFFGVRYTWFDLSSDGFMTFGTDRPRGCLDGFLTLGWTDVGPLGRRQIAYEVRGAPKRRRLVLSFTWIAACPEVGRHPMTVQLVLHERTGMIELHTTRPDQHTSKVTQVAMRLTTALSSEHGASA